MSSSETDIHHFPSQSPSNVSSLSSSTQQTPILSHSSDPHFNPMNNSKIDSQNIGNSSDSDIHINSRTQQFSSTKQTTSVSSAPTDEAELLNLITPSLIHYQPSYPASITPSQNPNLSEKTTLSLLDTLKEWSNYGILPICIAILPLWSWRLIKAFNQRISLNYDNVLYQLKRPDVLADRIRFFKTIVIGGSIMPISFAALLYYKWNDIKRANVPYDNYKATLDKPHVFFFLPSRFEDRIRERISSFSLNMETLIKKRISNKEDWQLWAQTGQNSSINLMHTPLKSIGLLDSLPQEKQERIQKAVYDAKMQEHKTD